MSRDLTLLGVASDGSVEQWDGVAPHQGMMLRWLQRRGLSFPDYGYDLYRAPVPDYFWLLWDLLAGGMAGETSFDHQGDLTLSCSQGFAFAHDPGGDLALQIPAGETIVLDWNGPAWLMIVDPPVELAGTVTVRVFAGGTLKDERTLSARGPQQVWRTRGFERVELTGVGAVGAIRYQLVNVRRNWTHLAHLCLPVTDPAYSCGPPHVGPTDEAEAQRRVPAGVDWAPRYAPGFADLHSLLKALATRTPTSFPASTDPDAPELTLDPESALALAVLDPHIARVVGLAWDDDLSPYGLDGKEWAYRIVGRWAAEAREVELDGRGSLEVLAARGLRLKAPGGALSVDRGGLGLGLAETRPRSITFAKPAKTLSLDVQIGDKTNWRTLDEDGVELSSGTWHETRRVVRREIDVAGVAALELSGPGRLVIARLAVRPMPIERSDILPSVFAHDPGPPVGPSWVNAVPSQPAGTAGPFQAKLRWELDLTPEGRYREASCLLFQVGADQLSLDPAAAKPTAPLFDRRYLLRAGNPILVPGAVATTAPPVPYDVERGLKEGWRAWWVRGIDLFGRVSPASAPAVERLEDVAKPTPPTLLMAEYAQADLTGAQVAVRPRSSFATAWLSANQGKNAIVVAWAWTPEHASMCPDVDGFRVYVRRPVQNTSPGPHDPEVSWEASPWGAVRADAGPTPVRFAGAVTGANAGIPTVTVTSVVALDDTHTRCLTDLALDTGAAALIGAKLTAGANSHEVTGNGEGPGASIVVKHAFGSRPAAGSYQLDQGDSDVVTVQTDLAPPLLGSDPHKRRISGVLVVGNQRFLVLGRSGATFAGRAPREKPTDPPRPVPTAGETATWYPAYVFAFLDTGFGPQASDTQPVGQAQVTVTSVRRVAARPIESPPATPGALSAVYATQPEAPKVPLIPSGPYCAELATRADWYGISRFELTWTPIANTTSMVYRALGDSIWRLDRGAHPPGTPHSVDAFPADQLPKGQAELQTLTADITALNAALAANQDAAIEKAYRELYAEAQRLIAGQPIVESAYVALHSEPLSGSSYTDELDGRSRAHWFYRVAARSSAGVEGAKSPPTPPICCPDVVPPAPPLTQSALAGAGEVKLRWLRSPESDLKHYRLLRSHDEEAASDPRTMLEVVRILADATATAGPGEAKATEVPNTHFVEYKDQVPAGEWFYRLVAEDTAQNVSQPSEILRGRSLKPPPTPPLWVSAVRTPTGAPTAVTLTWSHLNDQRLACLVERRSALGTLWVAVSEWLPRGVYTFVDTPPDLALNWEYRLRVRDNLGQSAATLPTTSVPAQP